MLVGLFAVAGIIYVAYAVYSMQLMQGIFGLIMFIPFYLYRQNISKHKSEVAWRNEVEDSRAMFTNDLWYDSISEQDHLQAQYDAILKFLPWFVIAFVVFCGLEWITMPIPIQ